MKLRTVSPLTSLFFKIIFVFWGSSKFHLNFRDSLPISAKQSAEILIGIVECIDQFGNYYHLNNNILTHEHEMSSLLFTSYFLSIIFFLFSKYMFCTFYFLFIYLFNFVFLPFLGLLLWHMEVPRLGVKSEL